jgi:amino acid adenylation domain-containing protein
MVKANAIHQQLDAHVRSHDNALAAMTSEGRQLTFSQLGRCIDAVAAWLRSSGVGLEGFVATCLPTSLESVIATFAIMKVGGVFTPLDPALPRAAFARTLDVLAPHAILTLRDRVERFSGRPERIGAIEDLVAAEAASPRAADVALSLKNLAYTIHTSGSSGVLKPVAITHRSLINLAQALEERIYSIVGHGLRVGVNAPPFVDASIKQVIQVARGGTLCLYADDTRRDPVRFMEATKAMHVGVVDCTPSQLRGFGPIVLRELSQQCHLLIGGEPISQSLWRELTRCAGKTAFNLYGPTEATVDTAIATVSGERPSIGAALANVDVYVADDTLAPMSVGRTGELYIGGAGLARGYARAARLTASRFVASPFSPHPGSRLYRTGDFVRRRDAVTLEFVGRRDRQLKIRGHLVDLAAIEATLAEHEMVTMAAVVAPLDEDGLADRLVAYVVPSSQTPNVGLLQAHVARSLPDYMTPTVIEFVASLPLTRTGKMDYEAINRHREPNADVAPPGRPGATEIETALATMWMEVLHVDTVRPDDNFFDVGGHSLAAMKVLARVRHAFRIDLPITALMTAPTFATLAIDIAGRVARAHALLPDGLVAHHGE